MNLSTQIFKGKPHKLWKLISSFKMPDLSTQIFKAHPQHKIIYSARFFYFLIDMYLMAA